MRRKLRALVLVLTAVLPGPLKRLVYRLGFGYRVGRGVRIGLVYLDCAALTIAEGAELGHGTIFTRCGAVSIGAHVYIGPLNVFRGGTRIELGDYVQVRRLNVLNAIPDNDCVNHPDSSLVLSYGAAVMAEHRIDFTDRVTIGRCSVLAGRNSSIWTHNRRIGKPVRIGDYCYLASEIRIAPGAVIPDCCIVGLGSVVVRPFDQSYSLFAGVPARRRRALGPADFDTIFGKPRTDLPDDPNRPTGPPTDATDRDAALHADPR